MWPWGDAVISGFALADLWGDFRTAVVMVWRHCCAMGRCGWLEAVAVGFSGCGVAAESR